MEFERGRVAISKAGRDKGKWMVVVAAEETVVYVADGKERPLDRPKRKNKRHLALTKKILSHHCLSTNRELRKALRALSQFPQDDA